MKILIVGLGYAGTRFLHAFHSENAVSNNPDEVAYVGRVQRRTDLQYFDTVPAALGAFQPNLVILSVNDVYRAEVGRHLAGYGGFVLCEKPFVCPSDDLAQMERHFTAASGFSLDLIERYSVISESLRQFVIEQKLALIRANFTWGKDRLGDHRPTCGVTSEIIHALDLVQHISGRTGDYRILAAHGVRSDFSVSGSAVPESISLLASLDEVAVTGYASFTNVSRRREIGFIFGRETRGLVFANLIFDDPAWDDDHLRVWETDKSGERILIENQTQPQPSASGHLGISKLVRVAADVRNFIEHARQPEIPFADLSTTVRLQRTLNEIHDRAMTGPTISFTRHGPIAVTTQSEDWERLG